MRYVLAGFIVPEGMDTEDVRAMIGDDVAEMYDDEDIDFGPDNPDAYNTWEREHDVNQPGSMLRGEGDRTW